jgi:hypothetical protein
MNRQAQTKAHSMRIRSGFTWFAGAIGALAGVPSVCAVDVFFDNGGGDSNYHNAINWSDDATVPHGGTFTGTATISNHTVTTSASVFLTGGGATLELLNGTRLVFPSNPSLEFGIGVETGPVGARVVVASNAVLTSLGNPNAATTALITFNPAGSVLTAPPTSVLELQPGATLSNVMVIRQSKTFGDPWAIIANGATIRGITFAGLASDSPSLFLTNTILSSVSGTPGGSISPKLRNGQTFAYVSSTPTAPKFAISVISIDDRPASGTNGGHFFMSGGDGVNFSTASRLDVAIATTASGGTSTVRLVNGARLRSGGVIRLGADNTQDLNDDNGSTVRAELAGHSVMRADSYVALGSRTSFGGTGEVHVVPFASGGGFFTYQTNDAMFQGDHLKFLLNPEGTVTPTFEVAGNDLGNVNPNSFSNNFRLGNLTISTASSFGVRTASEPHLRLLDAVDNANDGATMDALYVTRLFIDSGAIVDLNGKNLYYQDGSFSGVTFLNGSPIQLIPEPSAIPLLAAGMILLLLRRR